MGDIPGHEMFPLNAGIGMEAKLLPTSAWTGHIPFAAWLVHAVRPRVIVELGTHHGASYLAFCQAVMEAGIQCRAYAVDTWQGDPHAGEYGEDVFARLSDYHAAHYDSFSKLMRMTFDTAVSYFQEGSIDLLHVDGLHTYDAVRHDFETWCDRVSDRGVVLLHDIGVREREFGVWRFWAECRDRFPSFEFTHSHGLGVLAVGGDPPAALKYLCGLDASARSAVGAMFAKLGAAAEDRIERRRLVTALEHERSAGASASEARYAIQEMREVLRQDLAHVHVSVRNCEASIASAHAVELAGAVHSIQEMREVLRQDLAHVHVSVRNCEANISAAHATELAGAVESIAGRVTARHDVAFTKWEAQAAELRRQIDSIWEMEATKTDARFALLHSRLDSMHDAVSESIDEVDARTRGIHARLLTGMEESQEALSRSLDSLRGIQEALRQIEMSRLSARIRRMFRGGA